MTKQENNCKKKKRYETPEEAEHDAVKIRVFDEKFGKKTDMKVYECPVCSGYHLTSGKKRAESYYAQLNREKTFILTEASAWKQKMRIEEE